MSLCVVAETLAGHFFQDVLQCDEIQAAVKLFCAGSEVPAGAGTQLITAERISGVLSMLLGQCPNMTLRELKELIDRNPDSINSMLSFLK